MSGSAGSATSPNDEGIVTSRAKGYASGRYPHGTLFEQEVMHALQYRIPIPRRQDNENHILNDPETQHTRPSASSPGRGSGRRFKPTLNCFQCVQRKTKCDRARPACLACIRRGKPCTYNALANIINTSGPQQQKKRRKIEGPKQGELRPRSASTPGQSESLLTPPLGLSIGSSEIATELLPAQNPADTAGSGQIVGIDWFEEPLYSTTPPAAHDFHFAGVTESTGAALESTTSTALPRLAEFQAPHPFGVEGARSAWSDDITKVLPSKLEARGLFDRYLVAIDPVSPLFCGDEVNRAHDAFWKSTDMERTNSDPAYVSLLLAMYSCAAQHTCHAADRKKAGVYRSASHRALCLSSYLRMSSVVRCQAMYLICQSLIMDARLTEAWNFSGSIQRQACSLVLSVETQNIPTNELRQRKRLWAALLHQDHILSCLLGVHRSLARHPNDPRFEDVQSSSNPADPSFDDRYCSALHKVEGSAESHVLPYMSTSSQESSAAEYTRVTGVLQGVCESLDAPFQNLDSVWVEEQGNDRVRRQGIELLCDFHFHVVILAYKGVHLKSEMTDNVRRIIESAHESLAAFFVLVEQDQDAAGVWNLTHTLCYFQAVVIGTVLSHLSGDRSLLASRRRDPILMLAKSDFDRYLNTVIRGSPPNISDGVSASRIGQLKEIRKGIKIQ